MNEVKVAGIQPDDGTGKTSPQVSERGVSQVTLSTVGDLSLAATDSLANKVPARLAARWLPTLAFLLLVYIVVCLATLFSFKSAPAVRAFLTPVFPALIAAFTFWWKQQWKRRARRANAKLRASQSALGSLSHEATSAANAIQANLTGFRLASPQTGSSEYLHAIDLATARIGNALQKSNQSIGPTS